ncbi:N-acetylmuramoyl-L-alanine amidase [Brevibacillus laterosporus]|uniref:N-acetylmuramoyl-L-alanine amidase n=1 Tax=Brevibacillus laterosporus TaxID=1465 RepID=UPI000240331A|nr:N-acetylmuramoyl-L-alanine amidase [Brevibacillus laterosporus]AYK06700.1 N-acetylmuramoyl-L-alanine amidase [Brevibacillus laterosporus]CCF15739.1 N-acetylmuramoyl-L-alanine amidase family protein [Brevibacillus laterosporus GI-9]
MTAFVVIDPGHGGIDPGGGTNSLFKEKDLVLKISLYQHQRFLELNVPALLTRSTDITLESDQRASSVRNSGARYCLCNHINSGGGRGAEGIYSIHASSAMSRTLFEEIETAGMPVRRIYTRTLPNNPQLDYYFMHRDTGNVETVIIEYGFADNPIDAEFLNTKWKELAEAIVRGFCEFTNLPYTPPSTTSPKPEPPDDWKQEAVNWLYQEGILTNEEWRQNIDKPLPLWAEAIVLRRLYEKVMNK